MAALRLTLVVPDPGVIAFMWGDGAATWRQSLRLWPMLRAALFVLMYFSMYAAIPVLPLPAVAAGIYTAPLFVAALSVPSVIIATFDYCCLIFATLLGFVLFAEIPDRQTIIDILMIAGADLLVVRN